MRTKTAALLLAAWIALGLAVSSACQSTSDPRGTGRSAGGGSAPGARTFSPAYDSWIEIMREVMGPTNDEVLIEETGKEPEAMDMAAIAEAADTMANYVALGYGIHDQEKIEGFAAIAREAEAWLREVADRARAGEGAQVQELILDGQAQYCDRCHDAAG